LPFRLAEDALYNWINNAIAKSWQMLVGYAIEWGSVIILAGICSWLLIWFGVSLGKKQGNRAVSGFQDDNIQPNVIERQGRPDLQIYVEQCKVESLVSYNPNAIHNTPLNVYIPTSVPYPLEEKNNVQVTARLSPQHEIKIESLKLHIGGNSYNAKELPVMVIDREATYTLNFEVPPNIVKRAIESKTKMNYIQLVSSNWGWRSDGFAITY
jgi:hypothetical protein